MPPQTGGGDEADPEAMSRSLQGVDWGKVGSCSIAPKATHFPLLLQLKSTLQTNVLSKATIKQGLLLAVGQGNQPPVTQRGEKRGRTMLNRSGVVVTVTCNTPFARIATLLWARLSQVKIVLKIVELGPGL